MNSFHMQLHEYTYKHIYAYIHNNIKTYLYILCAPTGNAFLFALCLIVSKQLASFSNY